MGHGVSGLCAVLVAASVTVDSRLFCTGSIVASVARS